MSEVFDPYVEWLGIRDESRPPNHYRLLGLEPLETDRNVIANAADRQMAYLRTFQLGERSSDSQRILSEIAAAKVCLLNDERKNSYDEELRAKGVTRNGAKSKPTPKAKPAAKPATSASDATSQGISITPDSPTSTVAARRTSGGSKKKNQSMLIFAGVGGLLLLFVVAIAMMLAGDGEKPVTRRPQEPAPRPISRPNPDTKPPVEDPVTPTPPANIPAGPPAWETPPTLKARKGLDTFNVKQERQMSPDVVAALDSARAAFKSRDLDKAASQIETARSAQQTPDDKAEVERFTQLHRQLDNFWRKVASSPRDLKIGDQLVFGDKSAEIDRNGITSLTLVSGPHRQTFSLAKEEVPANVAVATAQSGPFSAANHLIVAAFWALDRAGDPGRAYYAANQATEQGLDAKAILEELAYEPSLVELVDPSNVAVDPTESNPPIETSPPASGRAVPDATSQHAALAKVRELLKKEYSIANTPEGAGHLALALLSRAGEQNDRATKYMMLLEAQKKAIDAGNIEPFLDAVEAMAKSFDIDKVRYQAAGVYRIGQRITRDSEREEFFEQTLPLVDQFAEVDRYKEADVLLEMQIEMARKIRSLELDDRRELTKKRGDLRARAEAHQKYQDALKTLAATPDDPQANFDAGSYLAFRKDDWKSALPHLTKAEEAGFRTAAIIDSASPTTAAEQSNLGNLWWNLNKHRALDDTGSMAVKQRAAHWYEKALPGLTDESEIKIAEARIAEAAGKFGSADSSPIEPIVLDNRSSSVRFEGSWKTGAAGNFFGSDFAHDDDTRKGDSQATFHVNIPRSGKYRVALWWKSMAGYSKNTPVEIVHRGGSKQLYLDQTANGGQWNVVGVFEFVQGSDAKIVIRNSGTNGYVCADAVRLEFVSERR